LFYGCSENQKEQIGRVADLVDISLLMKIFFEDPKYLHLILVCWVSDPVKVCP
jgi:hypothetical protein